MHIALIEQSGDVGTALAKHIEAEEGNVVTTFLNPSQALSTLMQNHHDGKPDPDLLILDIVHEHYTNGAEIVHRLREVMPKLPVLFIKGTTQEDERIINEYLLNIQIVQKPIKPMLLMQQVNKHKPKE